MRGRAATLGRFGSCVLLLLLVLLPGMPLRAGPQGPHAQPQLLALAAAQPEQRFAVIIQKASHDGSVEDLVGRLGGTITKDLHIINAIAADVPAGAVAALAASPAVRWISLDSPVAQASVNSAQFTTWAASLASGTTSTSTGTFNSTAISSGRYIWFNAAVSVSGLGAGVTHLMVDNVTVQFSAGGANYNLAVPSANITFDPAASNATTSYTRATSTWNTTANSSMSGNTWLTGLVFKVPAGLPGVITPVTWSARFASDTPGVAATWQWAAATYTSFSKDYTALGVKPCDSSTASSYHNSDPAGTPESYKQSVTAGATGFGVFNYTGSYALPQVVQPAQQFYSAQSIVDSPRGPNATYGYGSRLTSTFTEFEGEKTTDKAISRVEVALQTYVPTPLASGDNLTVTVAGNGQPGSAVTVPYSTFNNYVGVGQAGLIYVDVTASRPWQWGDFTNRTDPLVVTLNQSSFAPADYVYYDAVGLRVTSTAGNDSSGDGQLENGNVLGPLDTSALSNVFNQVVGATRVWNEAPAYLQGSGVAVAVVDSGMLATRDTRRRIIASVNFNSSYHTGADAYGHGTFVGGVVAGNGALSGGAYAGIAPQTNLINVRVSDDQGSATESDVVNGLQWVHDHAAQRNIKVVNLSLNAALPETYNTSPLDAAVEILWFDGVVVVTSAGNNGSSTLYAPANDPFVITVGATDDHGTADLSDDTVASFSAYGTDESGGAKPDLVAPGTNVVGLLPSNQNLTLAAQHPANQIDANYFRMSGTSVAAPMVAGAVALLLQSNPTLTPDQVKYRLKATANPSWPGYSPARAGAGYLDIYAAVHGTTTQSANTGINASQLLWTGGQPVAWGSVSWNSVSWNSVSWNSVSWNSVSWNSVSWNSDYWSP